MRRNGARFCIKLDILDEVKLIEHQFLCLSESNIMAIASLRFFI